MPTYALSLFFKLSFPPSFPPLHRKRIYAEEKAKVVAAVWVTEFIQFLAVLAILHQDKLKNRMNCTRMI